jgi:2-oxoglutarate ferredoxin oxidoreductase subunit beta
MTTETLPPVKTLTKQDFVSDQEVRWCPGCGDYSILAQVQGILPKLNIPKEKTVFVSGIGCSSRFPYYMNTFGFHSIHGRAPAIASGIKCSNPELDVWIVTGDGDSLSIGGNHFLHVIRRNMGVKILLFNNRIYGLTKGQYSPTSEMGKKTKSSPYGTIEQPLNPLSVAIASEATFVSRSIDIDVKHLSQTLELAAKHKGTAFIEIYQNCNIFNDGAFRDFTDRTVRQDTVLYLEHNKPLIFGKDRNKGIRLKGYTPEVVEIGKEGVTEADLIVHNQHEPSPHYSYMLSRLTFPEFPVPVGVFRAVEKPTYEQSLEKQIKEVKAKKGSGSLQDLIYSGPTWTIE